MVTLSRDRGIELLPNKVDRGSHLLPSAIWAK